MKNECSILNSRFSTGFMFSDKWYAFNFSVSGDHDMCVPFTGSEAWTRSVGYKIVDEWRPWTSNGQIAGYFQSLSSLNISKRIISITRILSYPESVTIDFQIN